MYLNANPKISRDLSTLLLKVWKFRSQPGGKAQPLQPKIIERKGVAKK